MLHPIDQSVEPKPHFIGGKVVTSAMSSEYPV
jgi:hypothetical protein